MSPYVLPGITASSGATIGEGMERLCNVDDDSVVMFCGWKYLVKIKYGQIIMSRIYDYPSGEQKSFMAGPSTLKYGLKCQMWVQVVAAQFKQTA